MKKRMFSCIAACVLFCAGISAQVFVIERSGTTLTYTDLKKAVDALQDNDQLYIPPGVHNISSYKWTGYDGNSNYTGTLVVNKKVSIYGAGYDEGANSTIISNGKFMIGKDASGTLVTGIRFTGTNSSLHGFQLDNVSNCLVSRCKTESSYFSLTGYGNNINISECDIYWLSTGSSSYYTSSNGNTGLKANFSKCRFRYSYIFKSATVNNCLFHTMPNNSSNMFENSTFSNNIIILSSSVTNANCTFYSSSTGNSFSYNLWVGGYVTSGASQNNTFKNEIYREDYADVFVDPGNDYHLKAECSGKNAGSDGTDVGIFGTAIPFKESKLPSIPNFAIKVISPETDAAGKLPVNIVINAQDN